MPDTPTTASDRLVQELTIAADASIGVIAIRCPETEVYRVIDELYGLAMSVDTEFRLHSLETGWSTFLKIDADDTNAPAFDPLKPNDTARKTIIVDEAFNYLYSDKTPQEGFFVMTDLYFSFPEPATQTHIRKQMQRSFTIGQRLFLIVPNSAEIPEAISPLMHIIEYGYPERSELRSMLDDLLADLDDPESSDEEPVNIDDDARNVIVSNGQGMTAHSFETAIALSITEYSLLHGTLSGFSADNILHMIRHYKTALLKKTHILELQPSISEDDIGGLDLFKAWMHQRKHTYSDEAVEKGVTPSRGALVLGAPGGGKSLLAKAAGSILNLPVIRFDVGKVFGQYIGQSEQGMRAALTMIDAMAPVVLMLDEIDKGFSGVGSQTDSGTTSRVFGTFLTWMQERDQVNRPVFLIMTANRVQGLPPELLRRGRIDETWSVSVPNDNERRQIVEIHLRKRGQALSKGDLAGCVRITDQLVGAEIEAMIEDGLVLSIGAGEDGITFKHIEEARSYLKPMSDTRKAEFQAMAEWADNNARPASSPVIQSPKPTKPLGKGRRVKRARPKVE